MSNSSSIEQAVLTSCPGDSPTHTPAASVAVHSPRPDDAPAVLPCEQTPPAADASGSGGDHVLPTPAPAPALASADNESDARQNVSPDASVPSGGSHISTRASTAHADAAAASPVPADAPADACDVSPSPQPPASGLSISLPAPSPSTSGYDLRRDAGRRAQSGASSSTHGNEAAAASPVSMTPPAVEGGGENGNAPPSGGDGDDDDEHSNDDSKWGRWTDQEHRAFLLGLQEFGHNWKAVSTKYCPTRTPTQIRSHAQKWLAKNGGGSTALHAHSPAAVAAALRNSNMADLILPVEALAPALRALAPLPHGKKAAASGATTPTSAALATASSPVASTGMDARAAHAFMSAGAPRGGSKVVPPHPALRAGSSDEARAYYDAEGNARYGALEYSDASGAGNMMGTMHAHLLPPSTQGWPVVDVSSINASPASVQPSLSTVTASSARTNSDASTLREPYEAGDRVPRLVAPAAGSKGNPGTMKQPFLAGAKRSRAEVAGGVVPGQPDARGRMSMGEYHHHPADGSQGENSAAAAWGAPHMPASSPFFAYGSDMASTSEAMMYYNSRYASTPPMPPGAGGMWPSMAGGMQPSYAGMPMYAGGGEAGMYGSMLPGMPPHSACTNCYRPLVCPCCGPTAAAYPPMPSSVPGVMMYDYMPQLAPVARPMSGMSGMSGMAGMAGMQAAACSMLLPPAPSQPAPGMHASPMVSLPGGAPPQPPAANVVAASAPVRMYTVTPPPAAAMQAFAAAQPAAAHAR